MKLKQKKSSAKGQVKHISCNECGNEFYLDKNHNELVCSNDECALVYKKPAHAEINMKKYFDTASDDQGRTYPSRANYPGYTASGRFRELEVDIRGRLLLHELLKENEIPENIINELKDKWDDIHDFAMNLGFKNARAHAIYLAEGAGRYISDDYDFEKLFLETFLDSGKVGKYLDENFDFNNVETLKDIKGFIEENKYIKNDVKKYLDIDISWQLIAKNIAKKVGINGRSAGFYGAHLDFADKIEKRPKLKEKINSIFDIDTEFERVKYIYENNIIEEVNKNLGTKIKSFNVFKIYIEHVKDTKKVITRYCRTFDTVLNNPSLIFLGDIFEGTKDFRNFLHLNWPLMKTIKTKNIEEPYNILLPEILKTANYFNSILSDKELEKRVKDKEQDGLVFEIGRRLRRKEGIDNKRIAKFVDIKKLRKAKNPGEWTEEEWSGEAHRLRNLGDVLISNYMVETADYGEFVNAGRRLFGSDYRKAINDIGLDYDLMMKERKVFLKGVKRSKKKFTEKNMLTYIRHIHHNGEEITHKNLKKNHRIAYNTIRRCKMSVGDVIKRLKISGKANRKWDTESALQAVINNPDKGAKRFEVEVSSRAYKILRDEYGPWERIKEVAEAAVC